MDFDPMSTNKQIIRLTLSFIGGDTPILEKTEVLPPGYKPKEVLKCRRGKRSARRVGVFQWGAGPLALAIFFVRYASWCKEGQNPRHFEFCGEKGSPADTLETNVMRKDGDLQW